MTYFIIEISHLSGSDVQYPFSCRLLDNACFAFSFNSLGFSEFFYFNM